jgi:tetratricopeptide (TPR) repeat protein
VDVVKNFFKPVAALVLGLALAASPFVRAAEVSNYLTSFYYNMGLKVLSYGFHALAGEHLKQVLESEPDNFEVRLLLTMLLSEEGELKEALAQCELLRKSPDADQTVDVLEGQIRQRLGQLDVAQSLYEKALQADDKSATAQLGLAQILALKNEPAKAEEAYRTVIKLSPDRLDAYLELSELLQKQGELAKAEEAVKAGININRQWAPLHEQLAAVYQKAGKSEEAEVALERAKQLEQEAQAAAN